MKALEWLLFAPFPFLVIAGRQHYSVDVVCVPGAHRRGRPSLTPRGTARQVVACYTVPMVGPPSPRKRVLSSPPAPRSHTRLSQVWVLLQTTALDASFVGWAGDMHEAEPLPPV